MRYPTRCLRRAELPLPQLIPLTTCHLTTSPYSTESEWCPSARNRSATYTRRMEHGSSTRRSRQPQTFLNHGSLRATSGDTTKPKPSRISRTSMRMALGPGGAVHEEALISGGTRTTTARRGNRWLEDVPILGRHGVNYHQTALEGRCVRNLSIAKSKSRNTSKSMHHQRNCR